MSKRGRESLSRTETAVVGTQDDAAPEEEIVSSDEETRSPQRKRPKLNEEDGEGEWTRERGVRSCVVACLT